MSGQTRGKVACGGVFHIFRTDTKGVQGTGPNGEVQFQDLWECEPTDDGTIKPRYDTKGQLVPRVPIVESRHFHNKWTKRGLSYMLYRTLLGHSGATYNANVSDITYVNTTWPFAAFVLFADQVSPAKSGDARPEFNESDGQYVSVLPASTGTAGQGRRGILLTTTTGIFKRTSTLHVGTAPYGVLEYTFYAQPNDPAVTTGATGLDNFPIKAVGLAAAVACGDGEASSQIGIRAICGLPPTLQGRSERIYVHEGQQQGHDVVGKRYTIDESPSGEVAGVAGYIMNAALAAEQIDSTTTSAGASDTITVATKTIVLANAPTALSSTSGFNAAAHTRKVLRITGSGVSGNNRDFTIREVVSSTTVKVFEAPAGDDAGSVNPFTAGVYTVYDGHNAFDGRVENYGRVETVDSGTYPVPNDAPGTIQMGEYWASNDASGSKVIGRIFGSTVTNLTGIRIMIPNDVNIDFVPNNFTIEYLDPTANGGNPRPGYSADWVTVSSGAKTTQGQTIYDAGVTGVEYTFTAVNARGIRLSGMTAYSSARMVQIAELMAFTYIQTADRISLTDNHLRLKVKSASSYTQFELDDLALTNDIDAVVPVLNKALRGYQMEALRSTFGYLWIRSTVAGSNSELVIDTEDAGAANTVLGLPATATTKTGITQAITKLNTDALTIVYRVYLTGNVPGGYPA